MSVAQLAVQLPLLPDNLVQLAVRAIHLPSSILNLPIHSACLPLHLFYLPSSIFHDPFRMARLAAQISPLPARLPRLPTPIFHLPNRLARLTVHISCKTPCFSSFLPDSGNLAFYPLYLPSSICHPPIFLPQLVQKRPRKCHKMLSQRLTKSLKSRYEHEKAKQTHHGPWH